jgi:shikimate kinase
MVDMVSTLFLTGPKHCGKTSAGKALSSLLSERKISCDFLDLDDVIVKRTGKTPRRLYLEDPAIFQKAEAMAIAEVVESPGRRPSLLRVISLGGGSIDNEKAVSTLKRSGGTFIYLSISAEAAWQRIADKELPPFLKTNNPQKTHKELHNKRMVEYLKFADIVVQVEGKSPEEIAEEIAARITP